MDALTKAIYAAASELQDLGWSLDDEGNGDDPTEESQFIRVLMKHLRPFSDPLAARAARIASLRAELESLEAV